MATSLFPAVKSSKSFHRGVFFFHGFLLFPAVVFKCFRELFRLRGLPSGSSDEFEFDSVDFRLSLEIIRFHAMIEKLIIFADFSF